MEKASREKFGEKEIRIIEEYKEKNSIRPLSIQGLLRNSRNND
jgi:hypothetical protein